ncbi:MAG: hypothetical protein ACTSQD_09945 [Promethearchaeota archaeon]
MKQNVEMMDLGAQERKCLVCHELNLIDNGKIHMYFKIGDNPPEIIQGTVWICKACGAKSLW